MKPILTLSKQNNDEMLGYLESLDFTKVKTRYVSDGWSALSIQGYGDKKEDILKPGVLGSKTETTEIIQTELYNQKELKPLKNILEEIPSTFERVRIMKLNAGTTIQKHTDRIDKDFVNGKIVRFHIPLNDNGNVVYFTWNKKERTSHLCKTSIIYYLDVVSHHSVTNKGLTDRYNLVVDVFVNQKIKELLCP